MSTITGRMFVPRITNNSNMYLLLVTRAKIEKAITHIETLISFHSMPREDPFPERPSKCWTRSSLKPLDVEFARIHSDTLIHRQPMFIPKEKIKGISFGYLSSSCNVD